MFAIAVLILVAMTVSAAGGERVKCQMVPLQTTGGLMGMCCVFLKNMSASSVRSGVLDNGVVHFPDDKKHENRIIMPDSKNKDIVFPGSRKIDNRKDAGTIGEEKKNSSSTAIHFPSTENKNVTAGGNATVDVANRNKNDTPETCTDGKKKDLEGNCVDPF